MADGLTALPSPHAARETADRLEVEIKAAGMTLFARINHSAGAAAVGMALRPNEVFIFGRAEAGTPLMQADPAIGIDLPLKAHVFEDSAGRVWLAYDDPNWLAQRHGLTGSLAPRVAAMAGALETVAVRATRPT